jgi:hypothetical protein
VWSAFVPTEHRQAGDRTNHPVAATAYSRMDQP